MARTRRGDCFYCDVRLGQRYERDHAPVPKSAGGIKTVLACPSCHHLKDRMTLGDWPAPAFIYAARELAGFDWSSPMDEWPTCWGDLSREARIVWAKIAREVNRGAPNPLAA